MNKLSVLSLILFILISCEKDNITPINYKTITLDSVIINNYTQDAKLLYYHEVFQNPDHPNHNSAVLDTNAINNILKIIQAVYDSAIPESDEVFEKHSIHARYCYSFNSVNLRVKPDAPEIRNLAEDLLPTGNDTLDYILTRFNFDSTKLYYGYPGFPWLTVFFKGEQNMIPVRDNFKQLAMVETAELTSSCIGDGHTIRLNRSEDEATIVFSIGWGDCPAGCINHKYWKFHVSKNHVKFIGHEPL